MQIKQTQAKPIQGFTLIEVLVALTIVAVALSALVAAGGDSARQSRQLIDRTQARWVASNVLTELQLERYWDDIGSKRQGTMPMGKKQWHWSSQLIEMQDQRLRRLDVYIRHNSKDSHPIYTASGFLLQPDL